MRGKREKLATTTESSGPEKVVGEAIGGWRGGFVGGRRGLEEEVGGSGSGGGGGGGGARVHLTRTAWCVRVAGE